MADVELRRRSGGSHSLDEVLLEIGSCCSKAQRAWSARKLLQRMDQVADTKVFDELARRYVGGARFPDLTTTYAKLGITIDGGEARLDDTAELAWVRDAIMEDAASTGPSLGEKDR